LRKLAPIFILCILCAILSFARPHTDYDAVVTRDPSGTPLPTRAEYLEMYPEGELRYQIIDRLSPPRDEDGTVVLIINNTLYGELEDQFDVWADDIRNDGYQVVQITSEGGTAQEMKELMVEEGGEDLVGCIFAGELPIAWYEHLEYFYYNENQPDNQRVEEYPLDLFYMDTDGVWEDTTGNGIYDHHYGNVDPDIWIGRLPAYNLSRISEVPFVSAYLDRIHAYRLGELVLAHRALNYIDDDWVELEENWTGDIGNIYGKVVAESRPDTTSASGYISHLEGDGYEFVQVGVHSGSDSHAFFINGRIQRDYFRYFHLRDDVEFNVQFYSLFACSSMNMTGLHNLCMGVVYAMGGPNHLGAVGPTKTGSMLFFEDYYRPLGEGINFGEALRLWLVDHAHDQNRPNWSRSWFYSMVHYGDPTLTIKQGLRARDVVYDDEDGDGDYIPDAGETLELLLRVENRGDADLRDVDMSISTTDTNITIIEDEIHIDLIRAGDAISLSGLSVELSNANQDKNRISLDITMSPDGGDLWFDNVTIPVSAPRLETISFAWTEVGGNGNNIVENGEEGVLSIQFGNQGGDDMHGGGVIEVLSLDDSFTFGEDFGQLPDVAPDAIGSMDPVNFSIANAADDQTSAYLLVKSWVRDILRGEGIIALPVQSEFQLDEQLDQEPIWLRHYSITPNFNDGWQWLARDGEDSGAIAFGGPDSSEYPARSDAAFELPLMMYGEDAELIIRHRVDIEPEFDAAVIEVDRGEGWRKVRPDGGYNGNSVPNGEFEGGSCWNGTFDWRTDQINLGRSLGPLRVRFRFSSDTGIEGNGWFIDRIQIDGEPLTLSPKEHVAYKFSINEIYPNPFNHRFSIRFTLPRSGIVTTSVYNLRGELVFPVSNTYGTSGVNHIAFNANDLSSGIYFVNMEHLGQLTSIKAVLLK